MKPRLARYRDGKVVLLSLGYQVPTFFSHQTLHAEASMHTITRWLNCETQTSTATKINAMKDLYPSQSLSTFMTYVFECDFFPNGKKKYEGIKMNCSPT